MRKNAKKLFLFTTVIACMICFIFSVHATIDWGTSVYISSYGQVVNSITYNGITVNAIYAPRNQVSNYDSDGTFCCAAFVKKFYSSVFGVGVNNLYPGNTPNVYSGGGYFYKTSSPQIGDIAASSGHWAIVKEVSGNTITLIEQNAWNSAYTSATVNRKLILPENSYWFWRWSGKPGGDNNTTPSYFTALWHSDVSNNNAQINATINMTYIQNCGFYIGTSTDNMQRIDEPTNANVKNIWFNIKDYYGYLYQGTTYYYKIYIVVNGVEYCSQPQSFTTGGTRIEMTYPEITFDKNTYYVGDRVNFSWTKTDSNSDFYQYWVIVQNTDNGKYYYGGATGSDGDISKNSCSFIADSEGKYKITVYAVPYNNKDERQKADVEYITVSKKSNKVTGCKATSTTTTLTLSWKKVPGATGYHIYYKAGNKWNLGVKNIKSTSHTYTKRKPGQKYSFKIAAITTTGKIIALSDEFSAATKPAKITGVKSAAQSTNAIKLTWNKVAGATGYRIYKYNTKTKKYESVGYVTSKTEFIIRNLTAGTKYRFKVRAYIYTTFGAVWGDASSVFETATKPATPSLKATSTKKNTISLSWTNVKGESGYQVYYSTKKNSGYKKYSSPKADISKISISKVPSGRTYYFRVRAIIKTSSGIVYGGYNTVGVKVK